jgi:alpha-1,3-rhamnosyltransferase
LPDNQPLVTVFTLIYNTNPRFVIEAIKSIRCNNYPNIQHIIIDDCSPNPEPKRVVKEWIDRENYLCEFYEHDENYGICRTLNHVLELAKGKYIFGCSDDLILTNRISGDIDLFEKSDSEKIDVVFSKCLNMYGNEVSEEVFPKNIIINNLKSNLLWCNCINANAVTIRVATLKEVGGYDENFMIEDYPMWLKLSQLDKKFHFRNEITSIYRINPDGLSNAKKDLVNFEDFKTKLHFCNFFSKDLYSYHLKIVLEQFESKSDYKKLYLKLFEKKYGKHISILFFDKFIPSSKIKFIELCFSELTYRFVKFRFKIV